MKTRGIKWAGIWVLDSDLMIDFYNRVLGMDVRERGHGYVHLDAGGGVSLELFQAPTPNPEVTGRPQQHTFEFSFDVEDVDEVIEDLEAGGVGLSLRDMGHYRDQRWIRFRDPEGNRIALKEEREQRVPTQMELVSALERSLQEAIGDAFVHEGAFSLPMSEGRTGHDWLASQIAVELALPMLMRMSQVPVGSRQIAPDEDYDRDLQAFVDKCRDLPLSELLLRLEEARQATVRGVKELQPADLARVVWSAVTGPLGISLYSLGVEQLLGGIGEITGANYMSRRLRRSPNSA